MSWRIRITNLPNWYNNQKHQKNKLSEEQYYVLSTKYVVCTSHVETGRLIKMLKSYKMSVAFLKPFDWPKWELRKFRTDLVMRAHTRVKFVTRSSPWLSGLTRRTSPCKLQIINIRSAVLSSPTDRRFRRPREGGGGPPLSYDVGGPPSLRGPPWL